MRKKVIRAFLGVYIAVCVTYGVVRGVTVPAAAEEVEPLTEPIPQTNTEVISTPEPMLEIQPEPTEMSADVMPAASASGEASNSGRSRGRRGGRSRSSTEMYDYTVPAAETAEPVIAPAPAQADEPEIGDADEDEEKQSEDASAPAAIPTLEDYLRGLHCGGCGRNCFLLNPHCMRGARKESQAESAYYEQYGESYADGI